MAKLLGGWATDTRPQWKKELQNTSDKIVRETGLSRDELEKVLKVLYDARVIH